MTLKDPGRTLLAYGGDIKCAEIRTIKIELSIMKRTP